MASGDTLAAWLPGQNDWPNMTAAKMSRDVDYGFFLEHDPDTDMAVIFSGVMPSAYGGGGVTLEIDYLMATATSGDVVLAAAFQSLAVGQDLSGSVVWSNQQVTDTVPATAETVATAQITFTDGAQMDSVAAGDAFRLRFARLGSDAVDTAAGNFRALAVRLKES